MARQPGVRPRDDRNVEAAPKELVPEMVPVLPVVVGVLRAPDKQRVAVEPSRVVRAVRTGMDRSELRDSSPLLAWPAPMAHNEALHRHADLPPRSFQEAAVPPVVRQSRDQVSRTPP